MFSFSAQPQCVLISLSGFSRSVHDFVHYWSKCHTYTCVCVCVWCCVCVLQTFVCSCLIYYVTDSNCLGQIWASLDSCPALSSHIPDVCTCVSLFTDVTLTQMQLFSLLHVSEMLKLQMSDYCSLQVCVCVCVMLKQSHTHLQQCMSNMLTHTHVFMHLNKCSLNPAVHASQLYMNFVMNDLWMKTLVTAALWMYYSLQTVDCHSLSF